MTATTEPTRAPSKALYLTDYARSTWDIWAVSVTLPVLARAPAEMATPCWSFPVWEPAMCPR